MSIAVAKAHSKGWPDHLRLRKPKEILRCLRPMPNTALQRDAREAQHCQRGPGAHRMEQVGAGCCNHWDHGCPILMGGRKIPGKVAPLRRSDVVFSRLQTITIGREETQLVAPSLKMILRDRATACNSYRNPPEHLRLFHPRPAMVLGIIGLRGHGSHVQQLGSA